MSYVYFVGIGGCGMSALARHLLKTGEDVRGSDCRYGDTLKSLAESGAKVFVGHDESRIDGDCRLVVRTSAVKDNCEIAKARSLGIPVILREQLLGEIFNKFPLKIAVCGTHGKTTVTAMTDYVLRKLNVDHASFVGGEQIDNGVNYWFGKQTVVAEACEYNRSFLHLNPDVAVCLNVEYDHPDCYADFGEMVQAYREFLSKAKVVVCSRKVKRICKLDGDVVLLPRVRAVQRESKVDYSAMIDGALVKGSLQIMGKHNATNAVATVLACRFVGLDAETVARTLQGYLGTKRRWNEYRYYQTKVVVDYAHHPTEISSAIATARATTHGKIMAVFQPHTYSRTKALWKDFCKCFKGVDELILLPVYSARETDCYGVESDLLARAVRGVDKVEFCPDKSQALQNICRVAQNYGVILILGAGDVAELAESLVANMKTEGKLHC